MLLSVHCICGETYLSEDWHVGRKIKCRKCDRVIAIERPEPTSQLQALSSSSRHSQHRLAPWIAAGLLLALFVLGRLNNSGQKGIQQSHSDTPATFSPSPSPTPDFSIASLNDLLSRTGTPPNGIWAPLQWPKASLKTIK